ncbi:hypothetical protein BsWGS_14820 [Bradybaena similaris]
MEQTEPNTNTSNSRGRIIFYMQIGLMRDAVCLDTELTMPLLYELACAFVDRQFPEHGFYNTADKHLSTIILLFLHDSSDPNILKKITSVTDFKDGSLVEIVLSEQASLDEFQIRPHLLHVHSYKSPHFCDFCGEMLFGLVKQGLQCKGCNLNFHKRCAFKIPNNCERRLRRSSVNAPISPSHRSEAGSPQILDSPVQNPPFLLTLPGKNGAIAKEATLSVPVPAPYPPPCSPSARTKSFAGRPMWREWEYANRIKVPHTFVVHNYKKPTLCQYCKKLLLGLIRQGVQCKDCKFNCHRKCAQIVPNNCTGELPDYTESDDMIDPECHSEAAYMTDIGIQLNDSDEESESRPPSSSTDNIPVMRVVQSIKHTKKAGSKILKEGWMVHFTDKDHVRKRHFWRLEPTSLFLYNDDKSSRYFKEIQLVNIISINPAKPSNVHDFSRPPHVFEIFTNTLTYFVGEDPAYGQEKTIVVSPESGAGLEQAQHWKTALRQALMPVTPQSSVRGTLADRAGSVHTQRSEQAEISFHYQIIAEDVLGSGQFGTVYGARHKETNREVAIKMIDKLRFPTKEEAQLKREVEILKNLHHPGVVNFEELFENIETIFVVMEKLKGDMLEMILSSPKGRLSERITKFLISQILVALKHLHSKSIVHCDLKPENVLLSSETAFPQVKLCDFGFARIIGEKSFRRSIVGTPAYLAPEVLKRKGYNRSLDMWSVGVIVYVSLSGTFPFNVEEEISDQIQNASFMYPPNPWKDISQEAIDLISNLLQVKMRKRFTVDKSLNHVFLQDYQTWCDLRVLETQVDNRYLTHESDDERWEKHRLERNAKTWEEIGQKGSPEDDYRNSLRGFPY